MFLYVSKTLLDWLVYKSQHCVNVQKEIVDRAKWDVIPDSDVGS